MFPPGAPAGPSTLVSYESDTCRGTNPLRFGSLGAVLNELTEAVSSSWLCPPPVVLVVEEAPVPPRVSPSRVREGFPEEEGGGEETEEEMVADAG